MTPEMWNVINIIFGGMFGGGLVTAITLYANRHTRKADVASKLVGAAKQIVDELQEQAQALRDSDVQKTAELTLVRAELAAVKAELIDTKDELRRAIAAQLEQSILVSSMRDTIEHLKIENQSLRQSVQELESENVYLRQQFEKVTGRKIDTGPLKKKRGES